MALVMCVDDNPDVRFLLRRVLEDAGFEVSEAASGEVAISALAAGSEADAVILDVQMPGMSGWETLEKIRGMDATSSLPVILCTVRASPDSIKRGYSLGCDDYIAKPFDVDQVTDAVRRVLSTAT